MAVNSVQRKFGFDCSKFEYNSAFLIYQINLIIIILKLMLFQFTGIMLSSSNSFLFYENILSFSLQCKIGPHPRVFTQACVIVLTVFSAC